MNLIIRYNYHTENWCVSEVFKEYHNYLSTNLNINVEFEPHLENVPYWLRPHMMIVIHKHSNKFIIISYLDSAKCLMNTENKWCDLNNCLKIITSSGIHNDDIPENLLCKFSYIPYYKYICDICKTSKQMNEKEKNELLFRGALYGDRKIISNLNIIPCTGGILSNLDYFNELTNTQIC